MVLLWQRPFVVTCLKCGRVNLRIFIFIILIKKDYSAPAEQYLFSRICLKVFAWVLGTFWERHTGKINLTKINEHNFVWTNLISSSAGTAEAVTVPESTEGLIVGGQASPDDFALGSLFSLWMRRYQMMECAEKPCESRSPLENRECLIDSPHVFWKTKINGAQSRQRPDKSRRAIVTARPFGSEK